MKLGLYGKNKQNDLTSTKMSKYLVYNLGSNRRIYLKYLDLQLLSVIWFFSVLNGTLGFPGSTSGKELTCQSRRNKRCLFDPWVGTISWRRHGNLLHYSCLENPHGQRSLAGYCPWGQKQSDMTEFI